MTRKIVQPFFVTRFQRVVAIDATGEKPFFALFNLTLSEANIALGRVSFA